MCVKHRDNKNKKSESDPDVRLQLKGLFKTAVVEGSHPHSCACANTHTQEFLSAAISVYLLLPEPRRKLKVAEHDMQDILG